MAETLSPSPARSGGPAPGAAPPTGRPEHVRPERVRRVAGGLAVAGAFTMAASAAVMYGTGADLFTALEEEELAAYLDAVPAHAAALYLHLDLWILGAVAMSLALVLFAGTSARSVAADSARFLATAAAGAAVVFFPLMAGIVQGLGGRPEQAPVAEALARGAVGADDVATAMIIGLGLFLAIRSGRDAWAPRWLVRLAWAPLVVAVLGFLPLGPVDTAVGLAIVPVGLVTMICLGVVGLRSSRSAAERS